MKEKVSKIIYILTLAVIFIIAVTARLKGYLINRPIWLDEINCCIKILPNFIPNNEFQIMPYFFLLIEKLIYNIFGMKEYALRFYPFICSIIAIPLFYHFSKIFLEKKWSIVTVNFLFAINVYLIFYAQEIKQYSSDVMWFLLIFILLNKISIKDINRKNAIIYIVLSSLIPLFSTPTYFAIGAWVIRELICCRKVKEFLYLTALQLPAGIITGLSFYDLQKEYHLYIKIFSKDWDCGFITNNLLHNFQILENNVKYFFKPNIHCAFEILLISVGMIILIKNFKYKENVILIFTLCIMFIFSYFRIYPMAERVILYSLPIVIILISKILDYISLKKKFISIAIASIFIFAFNGYNLPHLAKCYAGDVINMRFIEEPPNTRDLVQTLMQEYKPSDTIIYNGVSYPEYLFYKKYHNFNPKNEYYIRSYKYNSLKIRPGKYWLIFIRDYKPKSDYTNMDYEFTDLYFIKFCKNFKILSKRDFNSAHLIYAEKE